MMGSSEGLGEVVQQVDEAEKKAALYDKLRNLSAGEYAAIWNAAMTSGASFESMLESHGTSEPIRCPDPTLTKAIVDIGNVMAFALKNGMAPLGYNLMLLLEAALLRNGVKL